MSDDASECQRAGHRWSVFVSGECERCGFRFVDDQKAEITRLQSDLASAQAEAARLTAENQRLRAALGAIVKSANVTSQRITVSSGAFDNVRAALASGEDGK